MTDQTQSPRALDGVGVIIPALNEAEHLPELLTTLKRFTPEQIIVADNGSTDGTAQVAASCGATVVAEPKKGYGAACYRAMLHLADSVSTVAFIDADLSDDPALLPELAHPVLEGKKDFVIGIRAAGLREPGSMTFSQRFGNALATRLIRAAWGYRYHDLGPFRVIRRESLDAIDMQDRAFGWTIEMQIRALELGLRIEQIDVPYRCRVGQSKSKISGSLRGAVLAGYWILSTCGRLWWTRRKRLQRT